MMLTDEQIKSTLERTGYYLRFRKPDMYQLNAGDVINFAHTVYQLGRDGMHGAGMVDETQSTLTDTINEVWIETYGGEPVTDVFALTMRIKNIAEDRKCWQFNAKVLQKQVNEMENKSATETTS